MGTIYLLLIIIYLLACNFIPAPLLDGLLEIWRQKPCESKNDHHMALQAIAKKFEFRKNIVQYPWVGTYYNMKMHGSDLKLDKYLSL